MDAPLFIKASVCTAVPVAGFPSTLRWAGLLPVDEEAYATPVSNNAAWGQAVPVISLHIQSNPCALLAARG
jgi:hypothetical protein